MGWGFGSFLCLHMCVKGPSTTWNSRQLPTLASTEKFCFIYAIYASGETKIWFSIRGKKQYFCLIEVAQKCPYVLNIIIEQKCKCGLYANILLFHTISRSHTVAKQKNQPALMFPSASLLLSSDVQVQKLPHKPSPYQAVSWTHEWAAIQVQVVIL